MGINKEIAKRQLKEITEISKAQEIYNNQFKNINSIVNTEWYKEIKNYWIAQQNIIESQIIVCNPDELRYLQAKHVLIVWFTTFLNNIEDKINWKV